MNTPKKLNKYYDPDTHIVSIETSLKAIKSYYNSKVSICWGQKEIGETGYFQLVHASPRHAGDKTPIIVCRVKDLNKIISKE